MYYSQPSSLNTCFCIVFFYSLVKYLVFETNFTSVIMTSAANNHLIVLNGAVDCELCKSVLPAELQVVVYEVSVLELKDV